MTGHQSKSNKWNEVLVNIISFQKFHLFTVIELMLNLGV